MNNKKLLIGGFIILAAMAVALLWPKSSAKLENTTKQEVSQTDSPQIVSTKPDPLEDTIIGGSDTIEISFNRPLENVGEFKIRLETKKDFKVELSSDRKTAKIIPSTPYDLSTTYTLFIGPDTKFDGVGAWGQEKIYHFRTIKYSGV